MMFWCHKGKPVQVSFLSEMNNACREAATEMKENRIEAEANRETRRLALLNWIPSEIARQPALLARYQEALTADLAEHSIDFSRYGDFLAIRQLRNGKKTLRAVQLAREWEKNEKGVNTILKPACISLVLGKFPTLENMGLVTERNWGEKGFYTYIPRNTLGSDYLGYACEQPINHSIATGLASPAEDDKISFDGSGVQVGVPCGAGEQAFEYLLEALNAL